jgi:hypothetical protein
VTSILTATARSTAPTTSSSKSTLGGNSLISRDLPE